MESIVSLERGFCSCAALQVFLLQRLKGSIAGDTRDFNIKAQAVIQVFFPARQDAGGNSHYSARMLGEHAPLYATIKNWVAQF